MWNFLLRITGHLRKMPEFNPDSKIPCHLNYDGKYCLLMWTPTAGIALKWFKNNFCDQFSFRELDELAEKVPAGSDGLTFLPYLCGSVMPKYNPLCNVIGEWVEDGEYPNDEKALKNIIKGICHNNATKYFEF